MQGYFHVKCKIWCNARRKYELMWEGQQSACVMRHWDGGESSVVRSMMSHYLIMFGAVEVLGIKNVLCMISTVVVSSVFEIANNL